MGLLMETEHRNIPLSITIVHGSEWFVVPIQVDVGPILRFQQPVENVAAVRQPQEAGKIDAQCLNFEKYYNTRH